MLRLLLDEDSKAKTLVRLLTEAGQDTVTTTDLELDGQPDSVVLARATLEERVLVTKNCLDFLALHEESSSHAGILLIFQEPGKAMSYIQIVQAIGNLEKSKVPIQGECQAINSWKF